MFLGERIDKNIWELNEFLYLSNQYMICIAVESSVFVQTAIEP